MTTVTEQLLDQVMRLEPAERAELIDRVFTSDMPEEELTELEHAAAWSAELRDREAQVARGEEVPVPWREAMARIRRGQDRGE